MQCVMGYVQNLQNQQRVETLVVWCGLVWVLVSDVGVVCEIPQSWGIRWVVGGIGIKNKMQ